MKKTNPPPVSECVGRRLDIMKQSFDDAQSEFRHLMDNCGGLNSPYLLEKIREMELLYLQIAVHTQAYNLAKDLEER
jgi:hypothetical protein